MIRRRSAIITGTVIRCLGGGRVGRVRQPAPPLLPADAPTVGPKPHRPATGATAAGTAAVRVGPAGGRHRAHLEIAARTGGPVRRNHRRTGTRRLALSRQPPGVRRRSRTPSAACLRPQARGQRAKSRLAILTWDVGAGRARGATAAGLGQRSVGTDTRSNWCRKSLPSLFVSHSLPQTAKTRVAVREEG